MVDFPEGYGFKPGSRAMPIQETFTLVIGTFKRRYPYFKTGPRASPYEFTEIGVIRKQSYEPVFRGIILGMEMTAPIEGTLQQVVTALCTIHRMRGHMK
jgi:hypothetical protein